MMKKICRVLTVLLFSVLWLSCNEPTPFQGKWADNRGDTISFFDDATFVANIKDPIKGTTNYSGDYNVLLNSLVLSCSDGMQIVSEWDIRGNMLYITWTNADGDSFPLTLYKISN